MRYQAISENVARFPIRLMCRCLQVSPAGFYAWQGRPESAHHKEDRTLAHAISVAHHESRQTYGTPRIQATLKACDVTVSRRRIGRLMRWQGLHARVRRRFKATTHSQHHHPVAENILDRQFTVNEPNITWAGDITAVATAAGWLYLAVVIDLYSRRVVGWAMQERMTQDLAHTALLMAIHDRKPPPGTLYHTDRGSQYCAEASQQILADHGLIASMSRKGNCWDNACAESFFGSLKQELVYHTHYATREEARKDIFNYIEVFYNRQRRHSTIGYMSPIEFERMV